MKTWPLMGRSSVVGCVKHTQTYDSAVLWAVIICYFNHHQLNLDIQFITSKAGVEVKSIREPRSFSHYFLLWISKNPNMKAKIWTDLGKSKHKRNPGEHPDRCENPNGLAKIPTVETPGIYHSPVDIRALVHEVVCGSELEGAGVSADRCGSVRNNRKENGQIRKYISPSHW